MQVVYWPGDQGIAERTLQAALTPLPLPGFPGRTTWATGTIILAPTPEVFDSLTGGVPDWAAGVAIRGAQTIILPAYQGTAPLLNPTITLRHELAHLALDELLPGLIPRWFNEGYATWVSGGWDESSGWQIRLAFLLGRGPPLDSLTLDWPRTAGRARLAYLLSASAVRHLATRSGMPAFEALMAAWQEQGSLDAALRSTYGMTLGHFEDEWRQMVRNRYGWLLALSQAGVFWILIALLLIVGTHLRRRRNRERLENLRAEDYMLPPAGGTTGAPAEWFDHRPE